MNVWPRGQMKAWRVGQVNDWHLRLAVRVLEQGGLVAHATEGVWGLACDPWDPLAVGRLLALKQRAASKGLIVIGADAGDFAPELEALEPAQRARVEETWPGAVTWVLPNQRFPEWISGGRPGVAVRVPGHDQARALCRAFGGPLVSTSANRAGIAAPHNRFQVRARLTSAWRRDPDSLPREQLYLLPGETGGRRGPSAIRSPAGDTLRQG